MGPVGTKYSLFEFFGFMGVETYFSILGHMGPIGTQLGRTREAASDTMIGNIR